MPALELYDGPIYKVTRKGDLKDLDILIVSAKYGLLKSTDLISDYERPMTFTRAAELQKDISKRVKDVICQTEYGKIFISLGEMYRLTLGRNLLEELDRDHNSIFATGPIGKRLQQLKRFLESRRDLSE